MRLTTQAPAIRTAADRTAAWMDTENFSHQYGGRMKSKFANISIGALSILLLTLMPDIPGIGAELGKADEAVYPS